MRYRRKEDGNGGDAWVSLFSIPLRRVRPHFWTFSAGFVGSLAFFIVVHTVVPPPAEPSWRVAPPVIVGDNTAIFIGVRDAATPAGPSWRATPAAVMGDTAIAAGFWILASPILVEAVYMVFAAIFRAKVREEGWEEGREEGVAEGHEKGVAEGYAQADEAWREWNSRRQAAEAKGEPFAEPPPDFRSAPAGEGR